MARILFAILIALAVGCGGGGTGGGGPGPGGTPVCGDGIVTAPEQCDDHNTADGDGCSRACQVEAGWQCQAGSSCTPHWCGNGIVDSGETCDDSNTADGDGCSHLCQTEDGWDCSSGTCVPICGDGKVVGNEACDDGNDLPYDGCYKCQWEPNCPAGTCLATCGDGIKQPPEACDDGNTLDGDGCSADCMVRGTPATGWNCTDDSATLPHTLVLPVVYRDFKSYYDGTGALGDHLEGSANGGHPDFEMYLCSSGLAQGLVESNLDYQTVPGTTRTRGLPKFKNSQGSCSSTQIKDATSFSQWYRDTQSVNKSIVDTIPLTLTSGTNVYSYNTGSGFFPLDSDSRGWGITPAKNQRSSPARNHDYHFTSEIRYWFTYLGGENLTFTGDDDVWVFINGHLAVDLGGVHGAMTGSVTLNAANASAFGLQTNGIYELAFFHAERRTVESNFMLSLGGFVKTTTHCVPICGDGIVQPPETCDDGNTRNEDGCSSTCQVDPGWQCPVPPATGPCTHLCGNGTVDAGEECDFGPDNGSGSGCTIDCKWDGRGM